MSTETQILLSVVQAVVVYVVNYEVFGGIGNHSVQQKRVAVYLKGYSIEVRTLLHRTPFIVFYEVVSGCVDDDEFVMR